MDILIVSPFYNESPQRKSGLIRLTKEMSKYPKVNITVISSRVEGAKKVEEINSHLKIYRFRPTLYMPNLPYIFDLFQLLKILRVCKKEQCDVIVGYSLQFFSCFCAAVSSVLLKRPFICRIVGESKTTKFGYLDFFSDIYDSVFGHLTLKLSDKILVQSKNMQKRPLELGTDPNKISIVADGIYPDTFKNKRDHAKIRRNIGIQNSKVIVSFISRLFKQKGVKDLLLIANQLSHDNKDILFLIAGRGSLEKKVERESKLSENILYLGFRNDVPDLLSISDIFILPSYTEGLSPAILEALASGVPVITTKVGANLDVLKDKVNGYIISAGKTEEMKEAILQLAKRESLRKKMGDQNVQKVIESFNIKNVARKFIEELLSL